MEAYQRRSSSSANIAETMLPGPPSLAGARRAKAAGEGAGRSRTAGLLLLLAAILAVVFFFPSPAQHPAAAAGQPRRETLEGAGSGGTAVRAAGAAGGGPVLVSYSYFEKDATQVGWAET